MIPWYPKQILLYCEEAENAFLIAFIRQPFQRSWEKLLKRSSILKLWEETKPNNNKTDQESSSVRWLDLSPMQTSSYRWSYSPPTLKTDQVSIGNFSDFHKTMLQPNFSNGPIMALQFFSQWHHNLNNSENKHQINKQGGCCWRSWFLTPSRI